MPQTAAEDVLNALAALTADSFGPNVAVTQGPALDYHVGVTHLLIGVDDPDRAGPEAVSFSQEWAGTGVSGNSRDEEGEVRFSVVSIDGLGGEQGVVNARQAVFDVATAVARAVRSNLDLDVSQLLWTSPITNSRLQQDQIATGAYALLMFGIQYRARIEATA